MHGAHTVVHVANSPEKEFILNLLKPWMEKKKVFVILIGNDDDDQEQDLKLGTQHVLVNDCMMRFAGRIQAKNKQTSLVFLRFFSKRC